MQVAIISWAGHFDAARRIYDALAPIARGCRIIYSAEPGDRPFTRGESTERRDTGSFWADKFQVAIQIPEESDLLIIHADCQCGDWPALYRACERAFSQHPEVAVWCPFILGTPFPLARVSLGPLGDTGLSKVAQTDGLVVGLRRDVLARMRRAHYDGNHLGWGIDWLYNAHAYAIGAAAAVDPSIRVRHRPGAGYDTARASVEMQYFLTQMTDAEHAAYRKLVEHIRANPPAAPE